MLWPEFRPPRLGLAPQSIDAFPAVSDHPFAQALHVHAACPCRDQPGFAFDGHGDGSQPCSGSRAASVLASPRRSAAEWSVRVIFRGAAIVMLSLLCGCHACSQGDFWFQNYAKPIQLCMSLCFCPLASDAAARRRKYHQPRQTIQ